MLQYQGCKYRVNILLSFIYIYSKDKVLEIFRISTASSHRGRGVGRRLLQKMERTAAIAQCEVITLRLPSASEDAIKFHIRHGYHAVSKIYFPVF